MIRTMGEVAVLLVIALAMSACNTPQERALGGAAIGATGGALVGQAIGGNTGATVAGAAIGGVAGAMIGAGTAPGECRSARRADEELNTKAQRSLNGHQGLTS